jgi:hypothetical protein
MGPPHSTLSGGHAVARAAAVVAAVAAVVVLALAVGLAGTTLEPWGDSSKAFYALVADVLLGFGTLLLAFAEGASRPVIVAWRFPKWLAPLIYIAGFVAVAIPLAISAANSFEASSNGQGGPSPLLVVLGGIGLTAVLALLMRRGLWLGLLVSAISGGSLMAYALQFPH